MEQARANVIAKRKERLRGWTVLAAVGVLSLGLLTGCGGVDCESTPNDIDSATIHPGDKTTFDIGEVNSKGDWVDRYTVTEAGERFIVESGSSEPISIRYGDLESTGTRLLIKNYNTGGYVEVVTDQFSTQNVYVEPENRNVVLNYHCG